MLKRDATACPARPGAGAAILLRDDAPVTRHDFPSATGGRLTASWGNFQKVPQISYAGRSAGSPRPRASPSYMRQSTAGTVAVHQVVDGRRLHKKRVSRARFARILGASRDVDAATPACPSPRRSPRRQGGARFRSSECGRQGGPAKSPVTGEGATTSRRWSGRGLERRRQPAGAADSTS